MNEREKKEMQLMDDTWVILGCVGLVFLITTIFVMVAQAATPTVPGATMPTPLKVLCAPGYTKTVRPPVSYTNKLKHRLVPPGHTVDEYELDHLVPLELGGDPTSTKNLWMQPWPDARKKDQREDQLHHDVCRGAVSLSYAQGQMRGWK